VYGISEFTFVLYSIAIMMFAIIVSIWILGSNWGMKHTFFSKIATAFVIIFAMGIIVYTRPCFVDAGFLSPFTWNASNSTMEG